jgi:hypothetical protein
MLSAAVLHATLLLLLAATELPFAFAVFDDRDCSDLGSTDKRIPLAMGDRIQQFTPSIIQYKDVSGLQRAAHIGSAIYLEQQVQSDMWTDAGIKKRSRATAQAAKTRSMLPSSVELATSEKNVVFVAKDTMGGWLNPSGDGPVARYSIAHLNWTCSFKFEGSETSQTDRRFHSKLHFLHASNSNGKVAGGKVNYKTAVVWGCAVPPQTDGGWRHPTAVDIVGFRRIDLQFGNASWALSRVEPIAEVNDPNAIVTCFASLHVTEILPLGACCPNVAYCCCNA